MDFLNILQKDDLQNIQYRIVKCYNKQGGGLYVNRYRKY